MKFIHDNQRRRQAAHALMLLMVTTGIALATLSATLNWNVTSTNLSDRNNHYFSAMADAEAATEKIISEITADYYQEGVAIVAQRTAQYALATPLPEEHPYWARYRFDALDGTPDSLSVEQVSPWAASSRICNWPPFPCFSSRFSTTCTLR